MCGIIGAIAKQDITSTLLNGLKKLEYRGYDSAGLAVLDGHRTLQYRRTVGKIARLEEALSASPVTGQIGIAHTRWATHGAPTQNNAHPQVSHNLVAVVHNGIIENHEQLRHALSQRGIEFHSDTDTEVIAHLIYSYLDDKHVSLLQAVQKATQELIGSYAIAVLCSQEPQRIVVAKAGGSPLIIGAGTSGTFVASDTVALLSITNRFVYLENGDLGVIEQAGFKIYDQATLTPVNRVVKQLSLSAEQVELGEYKHFMLKEIFEQPRALTETMVDRLASGTVPNDIFGNQAAAILARCQRITIVACGSSYHAAMVGKYWLEEYAGISCQVEIASEFCYRTIVAEPGALFLTISQSGETADTLAALNKAKLLPYLATLCICNVQESSLVRESDLAFITRAGIEIGVATTKAFTAQLVALLLLTISMAQRKQAPLPQITSLIMALEHLPSLVEESLKLNEQTIQLSHSFDGISTVFYLGRGTAYPLALEGALKLKEISYLHAEGYPAGEMKHGALALVDTQTLTVAIAPEGPLYKKILSNAHEVSLRGGKLLVLTDNLELSKTQKNWQICTMPKMHPALVPIVYAIPLQLIAYYVALNRGHDIDRPRNLAKAVTVE